jgi:hypothetical protein
MEMPQLRPPVRAAETDGTYLRDMCFSICGSLVSELRGNRRSHCRLVAGARMQSIKTMKKLNQWIKAHPYKSMLFTFLFVQIAAIMAVVNENGFWCGLAIFVALVVLWAVEFSRDISKLSIVLALSISTSLNAAEPEASPAGVAVGVVVICVGGYCVYRVVKFCQKKFPKETASTNNPPAFMPQGDESAASWNYGSLGSCDPTLTPGPDFLAPETSATLFVVDVRIDEEGSVTVRTSARGEAETQDWIEFQSEVARHGIQITGSPDGSQYFSTNRVPCSAEAVPISFDPDTKTVDLKDSGGPVKLIEVQRSRDLQNWSPFLRTRVGAGGRGLRIEDATTASSMFYRVNISH